MAQRLGVRLTRRQAMLVAGAAARTVAADPGGVRVGLIGAGARGRVLLERLHRLPSGRCGAVCDPDASALQAAQALCPARPAPADDYRRVLDRKDVDAVLIATPPSTHFPIARDALTAGKHVFVENTLVFRAEEIEELRGLGNARPRQVLQVGLQRRYSQFYQVAQQMAAKGFLGEVTDIHAQWHLNPGWVMDVRKPREANWRLFREFSGGLAGELLSHQIDVANWVFGDEPEFVSGVGGLDWRRDGRDTCDNVTLTFRYPSGQKLTCTSILTNGHLALLGSSRRECGETILGTNGTIEITCGSGGQNSFGLLFFEPRQTLYSAEGEEERPVFAGASVPNDSRVLAGYPLLLRQDQFTGRESFVERELKHARRWLYSKRLMVPEEEEDPVAAQLQAFLESCRTGAKPKAGMEVGLRNSAAAILANRAIDEGRRVPFSELAALHVKQQKRRLP